MYGTYFLFQTDFRQLNFSAIEPAKKCVRQCFFVLQSDTVPALLNCSTLIGFLNTFNVI